MWWFCLEAKRISLEYSSHQIMKTFAMEGEARSKEYLRIYWDFSEEGK
jgi:hypothetical protein